MIVVEGPDGSGKTSLIKKIVADLGLEVAPRVVSERAEAMVDLVKWTEDNVGKGWHPTIYDRHRLISEPIYGTVLRKKQEPSFDDLMWLQAQHTKFYDAMPVLVMCLPPFRIVMENVHADMRNEVVQNDIEKIYWLYHYYTSTVRAITPYTYLYDYHSANERQQYDDIIRGISTRLNRWKETGW